MCREATVKKTLKPDWSAAEKAAAAKQFATWDAFFTARAAGAGARPAVGVTPQDARVAAVLSRHEARLLQFPNVVAVAAGHRSRGGTPSGEPCIVVYVERKLPKRQLKKAELLPTQVDGVAVDVVEVGRIEAQLR
jgi:hypothetical protein